MYKLSMNDIIIKNPDGPVRMFIPMDTSLPEYQEYLKWVEEGNEPLPADVPTQE